MKKIALLCTIALLSINCVACNFGESDAEKARRELREATDSYNRQKDKVNSLQKQLDSVNRQIDAIKNK